MRSLLCTTHSNIKVDKLHSNFLHEWQRLNYFLNPPALLQERSSKLISNRIRRLGGRGDTTDTGGRGHRARLVCRAAEQQGDNWILGVGAALWTWAATIRHNGRTVCRQGTETSGNLLHGGRVQKPAAASCTWRRRDPPGMRSCGIVGHRPAWGLLR
jgi:hypothetical protein